MLHFLILAGGGGTRLWPLSRQDQPKQFQSLTPGDGGASSLLLDTLDRLRQDGQPLQNVYLLTSAELAEPTCATLDNAGLSHLKANLVTEPARRNTAPAIALAARLVMDNAMAAGLDWQDAVLCILPADHRINKKSVFYNQLLQAAELAKTGAIVTLGITPDKPETGYGYIEAEPAQADQYWQSVARFVEKPDRATAEQYVASGRYFWNAGIFVLTAGTLMQALQAHAPAIYQGVDSSFETALAGFENLPNISFDYAVMEKAERVAVIPLQSDWSDIGSWDSAFDHLTPDAQHNAVASQAMPVMVDSHRNQVWSNSQRTLALVGVQDITVVDTPDATLICRRGQAQDVRHIVDKLAGCAALTQSPVTPYAWGRLERLPIVGSQAVVSHLQLKAHQRLKLNLPHAVLLTGQLTLLSDPGQSVPVGAVVSAGTYYTDQDCQVLVVGLASGQPPSVLIESKAPLVGMER